uniref:Glycolipid transfer protein domain-containing protein n=1 Tax=Zooxanthella nutricula TaxID=1333877 RepID=A0A7S2QCK5_9DINO
MPSDDSLSCTESEYEGHEWDSMFFGAPGFFLGGGAGGAADDAPGSLEPVSALLERAVGDGLDARGDAADMRRADFIDGVDAFAAVLDTLGGGMGGYLTTNTKKMRGSSADASESGYRSWLWSELPVHKAAGRGYVDDSAWMANLWIGYTLDFFVEFLAQLIDGTDTHACVQAAYRDTLSKHHNFVQRTAFNAALKQMPPRQELLGKLHRNSKAAEREMRRFVDIARPVVGLCARVNDELDAGLKGAAARRRGG